MKPIHLYQYLRFKNTFKRLLMLDFLTNLIIGNYPLTLHKHLAMLKIRPNPNHNY